MKLFKKIMVLVLAVVMVLPVVGCGGQNSNTTVIEAFCIADATNNRKSEHIVNQSVVVKKLYAGVANTSCAISNHLTMATCAQNHKPFQYRRF